MTDKYSKHLDDDGERVELGPPSKRKSSVLSVRLPASLMDELTEAAAEENLAVGTFARELIDDGLKHRTGVAGGFVTIELESRRSAEDFDVLMYGHGAAGGSKVRIGRSLKDQQAAAAE